MNPLLLMLVGEFAKLEIAKADAELESSYTDGGRTSGARRERMTKAVADAYALATASMAALPASATSVDVP